MLTVLTWGCAFFLTLSANLAVAGNTSPLVFVGDHNLPPYEFVENGEPRGANVDLARAIGRYLGRPVEVRLMEWKEAQSRVLKGDGDALTLLARTHEREAQFDFSQQTFPVSFSLFVQLEREREMIALSGKRIGVIDGGLPQTYFAREHPDALLVVVKDNIDGTKKLLRGEIDAFAANRWSGLFLLRELGTVGITALPPFNERKSNIAVQKGNVALLLDIDNAITQLKETGEFDRIIDRWSSSRVHLLSDSTARTFAYAAVGVLLALLIAAISLIRYRRITQQLRSEMEHRHRVEEQLTESQYRLDLALDTAMIGTYDWDNRTGNLLGNRHLFLIFGYDSDTTTGTYEAFRCRVHPEDTASHEQKLELAKETHADYKHEFRVLWPDNEVRYVSGRGRFIYDNTGCPTRMIGVVLDVTETIERTAALSQSERQFSTLVNNSPDIFARLDLALRHVYVSPAIQSITGVPAEDFLGKTNDELGMDADLCVLWRSTMQDAIISRCVRHVNFGFLTPTREQRYYEGRVVPEFGVEGKVESLLCITTDVTERELAVQELQLRESQLREADRRKNEFLATLAHELRNPLAPIRNAVHLLRLSDKPDVRERALDIVQRQVDQMVHLVDDLLDVNRITQGKLELRRQVIDVADAVRNAVEVSRPAIMQHQHSLELDLPHRPILIDADMTRITQVISNVLTNAAKYTNNSGKIRLEVQADDKFVEINVADNGIGISPEMLPHVFEMFSQVRHAPSHEYGGLGIGLALVKQLVDLHGGSVSAFSEGEGKGTLICLRLPIATIQFPSDMKNEGNAEVVQPGATRVLVVDDNVDNADSLEALLDALGCDVSVAYSGQAALQRYTEHKPSIVFLDLGMPGLDGYAVARRIRTEAGGSSVFLVALTGWGQESDLVRTKEAGFDRHLVKPIGLPGLEKVLVESLLVS